MKPIIAYTLNIHGTMGCLPECIVLYEDNNGELQTSFSKIIKSNKPNFEQHFDADDQALFNICQKLEKENILSKIKNKNIANWEALQKQLFDSTKTPDKELLIVKDYIIDYINQQQDAFFSYIGSKKIFIPDGNFPFMWKRIFVDIEIPEVIYAFDLKENGSLEYNLHVSVGNKNLKIADSVLVSRKPARIITNSKLYEFDTSIDGAKLTPFFSKPSLDIPQRSVTHFIEKVVLPLVSTNRVLSNGISIDTITEIDKAVLRVKEVSFSRQSSLFDETPIEDNTEKELVFELLFYYQEFRFWAGQCGSTLKLEHNEKGYTIQQVIRETRKEKACITELQKAGMNLDGKAQKRSYREGIEWINANNHLLESVGIELLFNKKGNEIRRIFNGEKHIVIKIEEDRDWFDIKGSAFFGEFEIPFYIILKHIRRNKIELRLPNGEYAIIPQAWFEEYLPITDFVQEENGQMTIAKQHCVLATKLHLGGKIDLSVKDNMKRLIENHLDKDFELPLNYSAQLRPYQQTGYNWLRTLDELSLGGCLADDMGLGKTVQTLALLQWMKEHDRGTSLLVVPTSLVYNWQNECERFCPQLKLYIHTGSSRQKNESILSNADVVITSYAILRKDADFFKKFDFNYFILDEAQFIKNPQSNIANLCLEIKALRFLALTGTPIENSITDLWMIIHFINRNMLGSLSHFTKQSRFPEKLTLYRQLIQPFLLRRHKSQVLTDLPEKTIQTQWCDMTEEQYEIYKKTRNSYHDKLLNDMTSHHRVNSFEVLNGLLRLRQTANHPLLVDGEYALSSGKFEAVCTMLDEVLQQGDKVLIFSSFVQHLAIFKQYLEDRQISYAYLDGSTKDRSEQVRLFQEKDDCGVFLLSLKAGGTGLNLTRASYVFLLDPWWNPAAEAQAYDRAHRIGQKNKVFVYKFISRNTIEEKILKLQEQKTELFNSMIDSDDNFFKQFNINDIMSLLQ